MITPRKTLLLALMASFALSASVAAAQNKDFTVVIDPGHGGRQPGAVSGKVLEKELNLAIALKFGKLISDNMQDVKVLYTRSDDSDVGLAERGAFANRSNADLFVSIHINALDDASANGVSTWVMGMEKSGANLQEAMRENEVIKYEEGGQEAYQGFDPSSPESYIMFQIMQSAHFERSLEFARIVQKHYSLNTSMKNRGAEQGPFLVLWKAAMPSVLTEVGFISNERDRAYISSVKGQEQIAKSLYEAFKEYKTLVRGREQARLAEAVKGSGASGSSGGSGASGGSDAGSAASGSNAMSGAGSSSGSNVASGGVGFYVQLLAASSRVASGDASLGAYRGKTVEMKVDKWYKYLLGPYASTEEAAKGRDEARRNGFKGAFVVAFDGTKQITVDEAKKRIAK